MKRFLSAVVLCVSLLAVGFWTMSRPVEAQGDLVLSLLELPAPPPPNPLVPASVGERPEDFYDPSKQPPDDAPIEDLIEYWSRHSPRYSALNFNIKPTETVMRRLASEVERDPKELSRLINVFVDSEDGARIVKNIYERLPAEGEDGIDIRRGVQQWLTYNSPYYTDRLERGARRVGDSNEYVSNQQDLLSLSRYDWQRAEPVVNRLYNDASQPVSRVLAMWALYRRALDTDSLGDTDRYRSELMAVVEDRNATAGMRDLAFDALVKEKDWSGRDEWYYTLLADETLADLRVNGQTYTGLTTLILNQPKEKYRAKMLELASSQNKTIRSAAVRNLLIIGQEKGGEDIVKALLPWLTNANWVEVADDERGRSTIIGWLAQYKVPEAVPGLIALLDEKEAPERAERRMSNSAANSMAAAANAASTAANAVNAAANVAPEYRGPISNTVRYTEVSYPHRQQAISALAFQKDPRAIPPLRRLLGQVKEPWERGNLIKAIVSVGGFSIAEQVDGLEAMVKSIGERQAELEESLKRGEYSAVSSNANVYATNAISGWSYFADATLDIQIGQAVVQNGEPGEALIRAVIDRIAARQKNDPATANFLRQVLMRWKSPAVNALMLRELKNGKATQESVVRLLALRKEIRETQVGNVLEAASGNPTASAISACMMEDSATLTGLLNANAEAAAAALACSRLLRIPLPIEQIIPMMHGEDKRLALAAEKYLESEDSHEARMAVLSLYPGQAKILGAAPNFLGTKPASQTPIDLGTLQNAGMVARASVYAAYLPQVNEEVRAFFDKEPELVAVYFYQDNLIRIYNGGRVTLSVFDDDKRYRERELAKEEFDEIRQYIADTNADRLPPFLDGCEYGCENRTLVLAGRNGGRIVFGAQTKVHEFFLGLDRYFESLEGRGPMRTRYLADLEIPGLEVIFAVDGYSAETVWKEGDDLRALIVNTKAREQVRLEIISPVESSDEDPDEDGSEEPSKEYYQIYEKRQQELERRKFEGIGWFSIANGELGQQTSAPQGIELPPVKDALSVPPDEKRWRVTAGQVELRSDGEALYRVTQGKLAKVRDGKYLSLAISADGKWALASRYTEEYDILPVRINLATGREFPVALQEMTTPYIVSFMPSVGQFLMSSYRTRYVAEDDYHGEEDGWSGTDRRVRSDLERMSFALLNPTTGAVQNAPGEARPIAHETFRRLQPAGKPNEFWAAMPDNGKDQTVVGIYDARFFNFKPVVVVPKMNFNSMDMWVDQPGGKVYFVYKGHVLAVPLAPPAAAPKS